MKAKETIELLGRFTTEDADKPGLGRPWRTDGRAYATDGRIAICLHEVPAHWGLREGRAVNKEYAASLWRWMRDDLDALEKGLREDVRLDPAKLRAAADAALSDAEWNHAVVILPGARRMAIGARYARLVADAQAAFGECRCACWAKGMRRGPVSRSYRILFAGDGYDMLLMALATTGRVADGVSVADAATGGLVRRCGDAPVPWRSLLKAKRINEGSEVK